jgi:hypothetical protein
MDAGGRYPRRVCASCVERACDEEGRRLRFSNTGLSGGFVARYADGGAERASHECFIDGVRCWADEAYFGGIVVEVAAGERPSAAGSALTRPVHGRTSPVGASDRLTKGDGQTGPDAGMTAESTADDLFARIRAAEEKAWWKDMTGLVGSTDQQLVVIKPRSDATADELRGLGRVLAIWKAEFAPARHIWGLTDLLEGRHPRTPPVYLGVPVLVHRFEERYEPVALVYVAEGTDLRAAAIDLHERLHELRGRLAWFGSPDGYCDYER